MDNFQVRRKSSDSANISTFCLNAGGNPPFSESSVEILFTTALVYHTGCKSHLQKSIKTEEKNKLDNDKKLPSLLCSGSPVCMHTKLKSLILKHSKGYSK